MSRIRRGYEARFVALLRTAGARKQEQGVRRLVEKARSLEITAGLAEDAALTRVHERLASIPALRRRLPVQAERRFYCDSGLGGLARWLRGAGYEAFWEPHIDDAELLCRAQETGTTILTTDSMLMERRLLRDGSVPSLWLPPTLSIQEQLAAVFREFRLEPREPRCMTCGGELIRRDKEALRERIPPRTYRWLDAYFVCSRCDKLYWHGTHWEKIHTGIRAAARGAG
jgi:uncharacterized protein with PIN domain